MQTVLHIEVRRAPMALQRILGVVERRGFDVLDITTGSAAPKDGARDAWRVRLVVTGERDIDVLRRQIARLYDVSRVDAEPFESTRG